MDTPSLKAAALRTGVRLQPHQADIAATGDEDTRLLLYHALGSGKTLTALAAAEQSGDPYTAVMPASLRNNFRGEQRKWSDQKTPSQVMSYTALAKGLPYQQDSTLVYDEAHNLRNPAAARTVNAISLAEKAKRLYLLSGSPIVNHPHDLVPALQMLTGRKYTPEEFDKQFIGQQTVTPGFFARWRGIKPAKQPVLKNEALLRSLFAGHVDYHAPEAPDVERRDERITVNMSPAQTRLHKAFWNKLPWILRWKLQQEFPLSRKELTKLQAFMAGPRQVGLSTLPFQSEGNALQAFDQSPKLQSAFQHLQDSGNVPSVVASNFLTAGLKPYAAALERAGISHGTLHGGLTDPVRKKLVEDYNSGKLRTLLLGPAGTEGISLKGTRLLQILDPHWNETRGKQTAGRGIRFDSHVDLPPADRNVRIQRFISQLPVSRGITSWFGGKQSPAAADTYLEQMAEKKERLNQQFLEVLRQVGQKQGSYMYIPETLEDAATHLALVKQAAAIKQAAPMDPGLQAGLTGAGIGAGGAGLLWLMNRKRRKVNPLAPLLTGAALGGLGGGMYHYLPQLLEYAQKGVEPVDPNAAAAFGNRQNQQADAAIKQDEPGLWRGTRRAVRHVTGIDPGNVIDDGLKAFGLRDGTQAAPTAPTDSNLSDIVLNEIGDTVSTPSAAANTSGHLAAAAAAESAASYQRNKARLASDGARNELDNKLDLAGAAGHPPTAKQHALQQASAMRDKITGGGPAGYYKHLRAGIDPSPASKALHGISAAGAATATPPSWARLTPGAILKRQGVVGGGLMLGQGIASLAARAMSPLTPTATPPTDWHPEFRQPQAPQAGTP